MAAVTAPILAVVVSDDELGTMLAIRRTLGYYIRAPRRPGFISSDSLLGGLHHRYVRV
jgi:predicted alpha/beta hydrolase